MPAKQWFRGAAIINDISGLLYEPELGVVAAETGSALVLMRTARALHSDVSAGGVQDVVTEVRSELAAAIEPRRPRRRRPREAIVLDPGFGFAKRAEHSFELLAKLPMLAELDQPDPQRPVPRKYGLESRVRRATAAEREAGTAAAVTASVLLGAHIVRVHNVKQMADVVKVADRVREAAY